MRRNLHTSVKITAAVILCCALFTLLSACNTSKHLETVDGIYLIGYGKYLGLGKGAAYMASISFDGETFDYTVPDEYKGYKITALGGYHGTGLPCPFGIDIYNWLCKEYGADAMQRVLGDEIEEGAQLIPLEFTVRLGRNISDIVSIENIYEYVTRGNGEVWIYYAVYRFIVDEGNAKFYSEDGRLYYRKNGTLVEDIRYKGYMKGKI